jgi:protein tyrosine/serine phosphatase
MRVGLLLCLGLLGTCELALANSDLPALNEVTSQISRGGRPSAQGLADLQRQGVRTVIDLEDDRGAAANERAVAARLGLGWISEPLTTSVTPSDAEVNQILSLLEDSRRYPIYIHCHFGEDRTGLIIGLYRVLVQRWTAQQAYREMIELGFHQQFRALDQYFKTKTRLR